MTEPDPNIIPESSAEEEDDVSVIDDDARPSSRGSQAGSVGGRSVYVRVLLNITQLVRVRPYIDINSRIVADPQSP